MNIVYCKLFDTRKIVIIRFYSKVHGLEFKLLVFNYQHKTETYEKTKCK